ncbi:TetR/AcrR family transcriptional regulator [Pelagibacterium mangrovi]|uniref:TetR/AcrR family transcriptional regulator n=1 Tax=Pelagibacterium mangrovi TaxID=3119828 RepID=UPI002FC60148
MSRDIAGRGDPVKLLELMWGKDKGGRRGPKPKIGLEQIVAAAVKIADAEGIEAVSTRKVAEAVGISPMSFYTHVPSKAELHDLMLDHVATPGKAAPPDWDKMGWRARMTVIAEAMWGFYLQHPWVLQFQTHRPVLGPNTMASYEVALSAVEGIGLDEIEMDLSITALFDFVSGAVRNAARQKFVFEATGMSDDEWWHKIEPFLETLDYSPYPISSRVGPITGAEYGAGDPERTFRFGLERFLDGMEMMLARKKNPA